MGDLLRGWRRKSKDPNFMLSVYGLCLMALPLVIIIFIEHFVALSWLTWNTDLREIGISFRSIIASIFRCELLTVGMGIVIPAIGLGFIVIAWSSMLIRRLLVSHQAPSIDSNENR